MKNTFVFITTIFCFLTTNEITAQSWPTNTCTATLSGSGSNLTLTIAPTNGTSGAMADYSAGGAPWYSYQTNIKTLDIQSGVTHIGNSAFYACSGLTGTLTIPNSVTTIGVNAFYDCRGFTGTLIIPNSVTAIGNSAFYNCGGFTGTLIIPNSVTSIGHNAFYNCSGLISISVDIGNTAYSSDNGVLFNKNQTALIYYPTGKTGSYTIPNSVISISATAFSNCSGLTSISVDAGNMTYSSNDGVLFNDDTTTLICCPAGKTGSYTIPNSVTRIDDGAFRDCSRLTGSLIIPDSVTYIGGSAFQGCSGFTGSLTISTSVTYIATSVFAYCSGFTGSLTIPDSVTSIGNNAFFNCSGFNDSLIIPNSVKTIGGSAFYNCSSFTGSLTIPNSVITIGGFAFSGCRSFTGSLTISNSITSIGTSVFYGCSGLTGSLTIPNSVTSIGIYAFGNCSGLTGSLIIPDSVTSIGSSAFSNCSGLTGTLSIPNSVTSIGSSAFSNCSGLTGTLSIPNLITSIELNTFYNCSSLTGSLSIPNSVTYIGGSAFYWCSGFDGSLTIPTSVDSIANSAFANCRNLKAIYADSVIPPKTDSLSFNNVPKNIPVYVPCGSKAAYQAAAGWGTYFTNIIEIEGGSISSDQAICYNTQPTAFTSLDSATTNPVNGAIAYQWQYSTDNLTFDDISGATDTTYTPPSNLTQTTYFRRSATVGSCTAYSDTIIVSVYDSLTAGSIIIDQTQCYGGAVLSLELSLASGGSGTYSYQWENSIDNGSMWEDVISPQSQDATYPLMGALPQSRLYRRKVSDFCGTVYSEAIKVVLNPVISSGDTVLCVNNTTPLYPSVDGVWTSEDPSVVEIVNNEIAKGLSAGKTKLKYTDTVAGGGCSEEIDISVYDFPVVAETSGKAIICPTEVIVLTNTTPAGGVWKKNNDNISFESSTANSVEVRGVSSGKSFVSYTVSNHGCETTTTFRLKVGSNTPPKILIGF